MQILTETIYHLNLPAGVFNETVLRTLFPKRSEGARKLLVQRALRAGEILRLKPGLFCLVARYQKSPPHPFMIAELLHFPSHISMESALRYHGLIPEAVREITSVTPLRSRSFSTALGLFSYTRVPADVPRAGVERIDLGDGMSAHMAVPVRAVADIVYSRTNVTWKKHGLSFLTDSLRMDLDDLRDLRPVDFEAVTHSIRNKRTLDFLMGLQKEVLD
jgi:hypothetical protein